MKKFLQKYSLHLALALPFSILLFTLIYSFFPKYTIQPKEDILYLYYNQYYINTEKTFRIENNKLTRKNPAIVNPRAYPIKTEQIDIINELNQVKFYRYNPKTNKNTELFFEEASKLTLNPNQKSNDGYTINLNGQYENDFPLYFIYGSDNTNYPYISKGIFAKKMTPIYTDRYYNSYQYRFLGWITE